LFRKHGFAAVLLHGTHWRRFRKGGETMSVYEAVALVFLAMMFVITLVKLMMYIADKFSQRK
jgi:flagellar biogenesis protein FliO